MYLKAFPPLMNDFVRRLPWRLGSIGGLLVGVISLTEEVDLWTCLLRAGISFVVFSILGLGLRALMEAGMRDKSPGHPPKRKEPDNSQSETGTHVDQKTPPMTPSDLPLPDDRSNSER